MRPKVVILVLLVAFCLLASIGVVKQLLIKHSGEAETQDSSQGQGQSSNPGSGDTNAGSAQMAGNSGEPVVTPEMRAAVIEKEIDQIQELQGEVDGSNNPVIIAALLEKLTNPESQVQQAALEAIKEINDTNAVSGLQKAADAMKDPRGKVAVMDVIDYLKLPTVSDGIPLEDYTNPVTADRPTISKDTDMNPKFLHKAHRDSQQNAGNQQTAGNQQADPANTPAGQPQ